MSDELIKAQITLADMVRTSKLIEGSPFKPGDVVQMKKLSGPWMTVESIRTGHGGHILISTVWFDKRRRVQRDTCDSFSLVIVTERAPIDPAQVTMVERT